MRRDTLFVVVTVGRKKNSYSLRMKLPKLTQNQFAYRLHISTDEEEWKKRVQDVELDKVKPANLSDFFKAQGFTDDDSETKVMKRLGGLPK